RQRAGKCLVQFPCIHRPRAGVAAKRLLKPTNVGSVPKRRAEREQGPAIRPVDHGIRRRTDGVVVERQVEGPDGKAAHQLQREPPADNEAAIREAGGIDGNLRAAKKSRAVTTRRMTTVSRTEPL